MPNTGMTPDQIRAYMKSLGIQDFEQGAVPSGYTNQGMVDPNAVYTPGGEYMGQYEMIPQPPATGGLLYNQPQPMPTMPPANQVDPVYMNLMNSGNQPVDVEELTSQFNLNRLLKQLNTYR